MVESCVELWIPQIEKYQKRAAKVHESGHAILAALFAKHNVSFVEPFKATGWSKTDKEKLTIGMLKVGYSHTFIRSYF